MSKSRTRLLALPFLIACAAASAASGTDASISRLVVQFRAPSASPAQQATAAAKVTVAASRSTARGGAVLVLDKPLNATQLQELALRMQQADPNIKSVEPDLRIQVADVQPAATPSDPYASSQWSNLGPSNTFGGSRLFEAWSIVGSNKIPVAVVDTGSLPHADVTGNEVSGYDFISDDTTAGDGQPGRDADPTDPGDFCASPASDSSWHGLRVAAQIGAIANNGVGIAGGAAKNVTIQHARALGRCGGWLSDASDAVVWSAGAAVSGVPQNPTPARVINMSLATAVGSACPTYMQDAINTAVQRGAIVVVAAGNEAKTGVGAPGNCNNVITVGAHTASGDLAYYSNHSGAVTLTAPGGGGCMTQAGAACIGSSTYSVSNSGKTTAGASVDFAGFNGTSAATPHVSAAVALLLARAPGMNYDSVRAALMKGARPHASNSYCANSTGQCGAGMLDAYATIDLAATLSLAVNSPTKPYVLPGTDVHLTAVASSGVGPYTYAWQQLSGPPQTLRDQFTSDATFTAPATRAQPMVFRITATDANGQNTFKDVTININALPFLTNETNLTVPAGTLNMQLTSSDSDGDAVQYVLEGGPEGMYVEGDRLVWPNAYPGAFSATVRMSDGFEEASAVLYIKVTATADGGGSKGGGASSLLVLFALAVVATAAFARRQARRG